MFELVVDLVIIRLRKFLPPKDRTALVLFFNAISRIFCVVI